MASERYAELGTVRTYAGGILQVSIDGDGDVRLERTDGRSSVTILTPSGLDRLRELLDRAAMPGQPLTVAALDPATRPAADDEIVSPSCNYEVVDDISGRMVDVGADLGRVEIAGHKVTVAAARELHAGLAASIRHCEWWLAENAPDEPLTVAAVDPAAMEALGQLADAVQEAGDE